MRRYFAETLGRVAALAKVHLESVHPALAAAARASTDGTQLDSTVYGLHMRALGWGHSIKRLDDVFDFQALSAGCRALFEITVDLVLLTRRVDSIERVIEWERLAKFRSAKDTVARPRNLLDARVRRARGVGVTPATLAASDRARAAAWGAASATRRGANDLGDISLVLRCRGAIDGGRGGANGARGASVPLDNEQAVIVALTGLVVVRCVDVRGDAGLRRAAVHAERDGQVRPRVLRSLVRIRATLGAQPAIIRASAGTRTATGECGYEEQSSRQIPDTDAHDIHGSSQGIWRA
jgi:hypothetical protein